MRYNQETVETIRVHLLKVDKNDTSKDDLIKEQSDWEVFTLLLNKRVEEVHGKKSTKKAQKRLAEDIHALIHQCFGIYLT